MGIAGHDKSKCRFHKVDSEKRVFSKKPMTAMIKDNEKITALGQIKQ